ncbi:MAG: DNA N-6-adenine-methyltransferase [Methanoregulaceae archaeon]|nr:DNA N-6-adenine-methyltransferase [Methanoregulaceae archaeon]
MTGRQLNILDLTKTTILPKKDDWLTPSVIYEPLDRRFNFDFDPCPYPRPEWDGLEVEWGKSNFVNPPYSRPGPWVRKAIKENQKGKTVVFMHPCNDSLFKLLKYASDYVCFEGKDARFIDPVDRKLKRVNYDILAIILDGSPLNTPPLNGNIPQSTEPTGFQKEEV